MRGDIAVHNADLHDEPMLEIEKPARWGKTFTVWPAKASTIRIPKAKFSCH